MVGTPSRVLVVDDSESVRALISLNLELEGFEVTSAEDGQEALEVVRDVDPQVITLDVWMPRLGGFETVKRLRADAGTRDIPVVLVTSQASSADRERAEALGVDAYLTKPFEPAELVEVVTRLARTGRREAGGADTLSE